MKTKLYPASFSRALHFSLFLSFLFFAGIANAQYTIFDESSEAPPGFEGGAAANNNDLTGTGVLTSVKFMVTQPGTISAIKFYKGITNTGNHVGSLWGRTGPDNVTPQWLAQVTFNGETADGWQIMNFPAPIAVTTNRIYTATLHSDNGVYTAVGNYWNPSFNTDLTPFIILAGDGNTEPFQNPDFGNGGQGVGNGAYSYTNIPSTYPTTPFNGGYSSANYYIDVVFTPTFALPVSLTDFKANARDYDVNLSWFTSSEQNNKGFEVQRSSNGSDYTVLTFVNGAGESSSKLSYAFTDRNLVPGLYYYRLKQIDNDGRYKFSPVVTATIGRSSNIVLYNSFPNPVRTTGRINYVLPSTMNVTLSLVDLNGRVVKVLDRGLRQSGQNVATLDATTLMKGLYFYKLEAEGYETLVRRVVVQ